MPSRVLVLAALLFLTAGPAEARPPAAQIDADVARAMAESGAKGLALAVVEDGKVAYVKSYGVRNAKGDPLEATTIMYGASLTKTTFAYMVMQLVDEGVIDLDAPISRYLQKPLPDYPTEEKYAPWNGLAGDERWRKLTARILLTHSSGFANFAFMEPDGKLRFHFEPGTRYAYSGEGFILLQFVLERGLGLDVGREMQTRVFEPFGMTNTSLIWRPAFAANLADGFDDKGKVEPHDERSKVRAAGSMDTTIEDMARLAAGVVRGERLSPRARAEMTKRQLAITTPSQFPSFLPELPVAARRADLAAGLGVVVFDGPQGHGFYKGGHNDTTGNTWVCLVTSRNCVVILANDVRAEAAFPRLVKLLLGETGVPWSWEYGTQPMLP